MRQSQFLLFFVDVVFLLLLLLFFNQKDMILQAQEIILLKPVQIDGGDVLKQGFHWWFSFSTTEKIQFL